MRKSIKSSVAMLATAVLTLALAGCGGDDSPDKTVARTTAAVTDEATPTMTDEATPTMTDEAVAKSTGDLCSKLDNGTITSITGIDFSAAVAKDDGAGTCTWDLTTTGGLSMVSIIAIDSTGSSFKMNRDVAASMFEDVTDVSVAGADDAFTYMGGWVLAMDLSGEYVQVMFMNFGDQVADDSVLVKLAEEVVKNW